MIKPDVDIVNYLIQYMDSIEIQWSESKDMYIDYLKRKHKTFISSINLDCWKKTSTHTLSM